MVARSASPFPVKPQCLVCAKPRKSRGLCPKHYMQLRAKAYDVTQVSWYEKVRNVPSALALITGADTAATVPVQGPVPSPATAPPPAPSHDAWVAAYASCQLKGESMDAFLNTLVMSWYERTFPALARGEVLSPAASLTTPATPPPTH